VRFEQLRKARAFLVAVVVFFDLAATRRTHARQLGDR